MAKKSMIAKQRQREVLVERYRGQRAELKRLVAHPGTDPEVRAAAVVRLQKLPRDSSATRLRNRDVVDGRPRGFNRRFGLSRVRLREMAHRGELPGVRKASW
ncbi:30S ribosomal protein S14 [Glycomyces algeriensis]|uniref:Small ribosomal subunit protein uS14 n=1 Tax=Glycomyces algeriensis TaxID=256037 RepID=A0A9W6G8H1_9ACTN|nr:30S ribosomal protein S14 [Glycomyces algeriensis]MDA1367953.1 30S ribosomal protein S14 [Glycomyces algeriensis]MDR7349492.1 small subunit ribosomal protein S14 [Glycomyces algeriensis]GLI42198.1 30S ribosomal protein S14 [Glycomyces algeriensis]